MLEPALLWARMPRLFAALALFYGAVERRTSPLAPALRSLVMVRISQLNGCPYCVDLNMAMLLERGAPVEKVEALPGWRDSDVFDAQERATLDYAEAMTLSDRQVGDAQMGALKEHFDEQAIVELTAVIAFQNMSSKFNTALDVAPQGFCALPPGPETAPARGPGPVSR